MVHLTKWKLGLLGTVVLVSLLAVFFFLRFSVVSAANVFAVNNLKTGGVLMSTSVQAANQDMPAMGHWILVANTISTNLSILNTANNVVYGPFLQGELGKESSELLDIAVTPDGRTALVSNFEDKKISFVDLSDPMNLTVTHSITVPMFAEDIAITQNGKYAVVSDGGLSSMLATIDIPAATMVFTTDLGSEDAQAVMVAPDGTVAVADYLGHSVHTLTMDDMGALTPASTYTYTFPGHPITDTDNMPWPLNLALAPDGQTIIVCNAFTSTIAVYQIMAPGVLDFKGLITGLEGNFPPGTFDQSQGVQSVAFNDAGDKGIAVVNGYVYSTTAYDDRIAILDVNGPGQVSLEAGGLITIPHKTSGQYFGVDTVAVADNQVYLGYPTSFLMDDSDYTNLAIVNLNDNSVTATMVLSQGISMPAGVAAVPIQLYMQKLVSDPETLPNRVITYTLVLSNVGPQVTGLTILDTLPEGVDFAGPITLDPPDAGTVGSAPPELATNVVIPIDHLVTVTFPVMVGDLPDGAVITNTASAESPELFQPVMAEQSFVMKWLKVYILPVLNNFGFGP